MNIPDLKIEVSVPQEVVQAAELGQLILFIGSGVSMRMGLPSWQQFANSVLTDLISRERLTHDDFTQLKVLDPRTTLSIARILDAELDFTQHFRKVEQTSNIYDSLNSIGCTSVTTNYDLCFVPSSHPSGDGNSTSKQSERITSQNALLPSVLDSLGNVIHLHGAIANPSTMVITTGDYLKHYESEHVQAFLKHLFKMKTVVFLGYGLAENELLEHILRHGAIDRSHSERKLFCIQGFHSSETSVYTHLYKYFEHSFGLRLLGFLLDKAS